MIRPQASVKPSEALARQPPNLESATQSIDRIVNDAKRAVDIVQRWPAWPAEKAFDTGGRVGGVFDWWGKK